MSDKAFWSGELCFGIVNIPISLHVSRSSHDHVFKQYTADPLMGESSHVGPVSPVGRLMINKNTKHEVQQKDVLRGIEVTGVGLVCVDKAKLDALTPETNHLVKIEKFFKLGSFDFTRYDMHYNVVSNSPNETDQKAFKLLEIEMCGQQVGAFLQIKLRHRNQLALLHSHRNKGIVLSTLFYEDELIKPPVRADMKPPVITMNERQVASKLIQAMLVEDSEYADQKDEYWYNVTNLIVDTANGEA